MSQRKAYSITKSDADNLPVFITKIYVGGTGDIKVALAKDEDADAVVLKAVPVGTVLDIGVIRKVFSTGTTATLLIGFHS